MGRKMQYLYSVLSLVIGAVVISVLIFVHELGHFIAAKALKIKVFIFAVGFGKTLFMRKRGDTEFRFNAIPFGGYIQMAQDVSDENERAEAVKEYMAKPIWQRAVVAFAGPAASFLFAVLTIYAIYINGIYRYCYLDSTMIGSVMRDTPADSAGFLSGDSIVSINGASVSDWEQVRTQLWRQKSRGCKVVVSRTGELVELELRTFRRNYDLSEKRTGGLLPARYPPIVCWVDSNSCAYGLLKESDTLLAVNGVRVSSFEHFTALIEPYIDKIDSAVAVDIKRGERLAHISMVPAAGELTGWSGLYMVDEPARFVRFGAIAAIGPVMNEAGWYLTMPLLALYSVYKGIKNIDTDINVSEVLSEFSKVPDNVIGPIGIIARAGADATKGLAVLLEFMLKIGMCIAAFNLLPLAVTDGGVLMFLGIEAIRRKPLSDKWQGRINTFFIALLLLWILYISVYDILKLPEILGWK